MLGLNNRNVFKEIANFGLRIVEGIEQRVGGWRSGPAGLEVGGKAE